MAVLAKKLDLHDIPSIAEARPASEDRDSSLEKNIQQRGAPSIHMIHIRRIRRIKAVQLLVAEEDSKLKLKRDEAVVRSSDELLKKFLEK